MTLVAAVFTPFDADGGLALERVEQQAEAVAAWGSPAVYVGGTAGEGASLATTERMALLERWCDVAASRMDVIAHVGHSSLAEARELATHASDVGANAISAVAPYFHRPGDVAALTGFCRRIAESAPGLPFIYYHIPSVTGVHLPASDFLRVAIEEIPSFAGIKFAHDDLADLDRCLDIAGEEYEIYLGAAKIMLPALRLGARAAIGSAYNFAAPLFQRLCEHVRLGELRAARDCQELARVVIDMAAQYGGELPGFKALTGLVSHDCGPCRAPLSSPTSLQLADLRLRLLRVGFLDGSEAA